MRAILAILLTGALLMPLPTYSQSPNAVDAFLAAAKAQDHPKMLGLMTSSVTMINGGDKTSKDFVELISQCEPMNPGGGIMGWLCPAGVGGHKTCWVIAGSYKPEGDKVALRGFGNPGFPLKCDPPNP